MSSSGKGQSLVKSADELEHAWEYGCSGSRGDIRELIIEEFIKFDSEITLFSYAEKRTYTVLSSYRTRTKGEETTARASNRHTSTLHI